ncbi:MAG: hypothetical protein IJ704_05850 [Bacilli bacterium]|nr:hypothetical protein [Bacilli bacterium]
MIDTLEKEEKVFLRDEVARKVFSSFPSSLSYASLIISKVLDIPFEDVKKNIVPNPNLLANFKTNVNHEADLVYSLNNDWIDIEINYNKYKDGLVKNALYTASLMLKGIRFKSDYKKYKRPILIQLDGYQRFKKKKFIYRSSTLENDLLEELEEMPVIYDINLPFLDEISYNELVSEEHSLEKCLYFFVNSNEEVLSNLYKGDEIMEQVKKDVDEFMDGLDQFVYEKRKEIDEQSYFNAGLEQGIEQGSKEKALEIAKNLLAENLGLQTIAKTTGLSINEISKLKESM